MTNVENPDFKCNYMVRNDIYRNASSLRSHVYRKHRLSQPRRNRTIASVVDPDFDFMDFDDDDDPEENTDSEDDEDSESNFNEDDQDERPGFVDDVPDNPKKEIIGQHLLYLRGQTRATNNDVLGILKNLQSVVKSYVEYYLRKANDTLFSHAGFHLTDYISIEDMVDEMDCSE